MKRLKTLFENLKRERHFNPSKSACNISNSNTADTCVCCGNYVPEGSIVCSECNRRYASK